MTKNFKIIYRGFDKKLDNLLEKALKKCGYSVWAAGFDFKTGERDLAFEKETKRGDRK